MKYINLSIILKLFQYFCLSKHCLDCSSSEEVRVPERGRVRVISVVHKDLSPLRNGLEGSDSQASQTKPRVLEPDKHGVRLEAVVDFVCERGPVVVGVPVLAGEVHGVAGGRISPVQVDHVVGGLRLPSLPRSVDEAVVETDDCVCRDLSPGKQPVSPTWYSRLSASDKTRPYYFQG